MRHGLGKFRILGEVEAAIDDIHGETRDAQPLFAACIHLRELSDGWHLSHQSQGVKAALFDGARRPR
jgi:hypothetical protein